MDNQERRPILAKGEEYIVPYKYKNSPPKKDTRPSFDEARVRLSSEVKGAIECVGKVPREFIMDEFIVNIKMRTDYSAKSYHPTDFIVQANAEEVGSKKWTKEVPTKKDSTKNEVKIGKEIFLRVNKNSLIDLDQQLSRNSNFTKGTIENIRSIENLYFDDHSPLIDKFSPEWDEGKVEFVLHPFDRRTEDAKSQFLDLVKKYEGDPSKAKFKTYASGITFISIPLKRKTLENVLRFNPIRTAHPINLSSLPVIRSGGTALPLPPPPQNKQKSSIKLGVFDGGIDASSPYLSEFVTEYNPIKTDKDMSFLSHGVGVVGAALYGDLSKYNNKTELPTPRINVDSFRVFPLSDNRDIDLYEVIDIIEDIVPKRPDIQVFNLSIGPYGAIDDDNITRFTYAIDELSKKGTPLFTVAVGNDGDLGNDELCRIQAPSDAVNCIGIGAYSRGRDGICDRASYSCYGDGREGCKIKPDFLDYGGSPENPFHLVSVDWRGRSFACGTSFASPLSAAKAAEVIGRCSFANPLMARALLVHTSQHPLYKSDKYVGHGFACEEVDEILTCGNCAVTTLYQSRLRPTQAIKLPFPFLHDLAYSGKVVVQWTIALATGIDAKNSEDYTLSCIEDTFYPHDKKYKFFNEKTNKRISVDIGREKNVMDELLADGWLMSRNPSSYSLFSNKYKTEQERKQNFKWDTIIKRRAVLKYDSLQNPYLILHAMNRLGSDDDFVNYAAVVTLDYVNCDKDVYDLTTKFYNKLEVARIKTLNEIYVK